MHRRQFQIWDPTHKLIFLDIVFKVDTFHIGGREESEVKNKQIKKST